MTIQEKTKHRNMIVDLSNLVFSTRFAAIKTPKTKARKESYIPEMIFKDTLLTIIKYANEFKSDSIVIACDGQKVWRKSIYPEYKANREHTDIYYEETIEASNLLQSYFRECTNVAVLNVDHCEADDIIAVFVKESQGVENIILSADKDFVQLIDENTHLYSPTQDTWRTSENPQYDLFVKCIRGDTNDNIFSAYPRVRSKRLSEAWEDEYKMLNVLETVRKDGVKVADAYLLNEQLIDLTKQPDYIKDNIRESIEQPVQKNFGDFKIAKWFGDHGLKKFAWALEYKKEPLKKPFKIKG